MSRTRVQEPPAEGRATAAANEEFNRLVSATDEGEHTASGWDPYEVWRTRVRMPAQLKKERARVSESGQ